MFLFQKLEKLECFRTIHYYNYPIVNEQRFPPVKLHVTIWKMSKTEIWLRTVQHLPKQINNEKWTKNKNGNDKKKEEKKEKKKNKSKKKTTSIWIVTHRIRLARKKIWIFMLKNLLHLDNCALEMWIYELTENPFGFKKKQQQQNTNFPSLKPVIHKKCQ